MFPVCPSENSVILTIRWYPRRIAEFKFGKQIFPFLNRCFEIVFVGKEVHFYLLIVIKSSQDTPDVIHFLTLMSV